MSMVKMVDEELKMDVSEDMSAASITASIIPRSPGTDVNNYVIFETVYLYNSKVQLGKLYYKNRPQK
jgi:hypothetical protein